MTTGLIPMADPALVKLMKSDRDGMVQELMHTALTLM